MCIYDATHYTCTGEEIALVEQCPLPAHLLPHIRQVLYQGSVCRLCAIAGLEPEAQILLSRSPDLQMLAPSPETQQPVAIDGESLAARASTSENASVQQFDNLQTNDEAGDDIINMPDTDTFVASTADEAAEAEENVLYDVSDVPALADIAAALPQLNLDFVFLQVDDVHGKVTCEKKLRKRRLRGLRARQEWPSNVRPSSG